MMKHPKWQSAVHESGHAIAARLFGRMVVCIDLETGSGAAVITPYERKNTPETIRQMLVIYAAGEAAVRRFIRTPEYDGGEDDRSKIKEHARRLHGILASKEVVQKEIDAAVKRAEKVVEQYEETIMKLSRSMIASYQVLQKIEPRQTEAFITY